MFGLFIAGAVIAVMLAALNTANDKLSAVARGVAVSLDVFFAFLLIWGALHS